MFYRVCTESYCFTGYALNHIDLPGMHWIKLVYRVCIESWESKHRLSYRCRCVWWRHVTLVIENSPFSSLEVHVPLRAATRYGQRRRTFSKKASGVHDMFTDILILEKVADQRCLYLQHYKTTYTKSVIGTWSTDKKTQNGHNKTALIVNLFLLSV